MIFNVQGHIEMIKNGLHYAKYRYYYHPSLVVKTQTRRPNRGTYQVGKDYAVQRKRGAKGEPDIRIVMDRIWEETTAIYHRENSTIETITISRKDAWAEGGYSPMEYEKIFLKLNPKRNRFSRWAFAFHVIEVQK